MWGFNFKKRRIYEINPDEIFLDSENLSNLNQQQFEGVIEQPIRKRSLYLVLLATLIIGSIFISRLYILQVKKGEAFYTQSENNRLHRAPIFGERGVIYDRNNKELAWNVLGNEAEPFSYRQYTSDLGFGHILGYVGYPQKDSNGYYWQEDLIGKDGIEKFLNEELSGERGTKLVELDALGKIQSESQIVEAVNGENVRLTIDAGIQAKLYESIGLMTQDFGYEAGAGVIMDIRTGELLALVSYPDYDPGVLSEGSDVETINNYFNDPAKPFLDRASSGLYTPGSIVKPFMALAALDLGVITSRTIIKSTGTIEVPNPYNPDDVSIFKDWRDEGHGRTDVKHAIADSVNTFFYAISGGYKKQEGIGIKNIEKYMKLFKVGEPTGFVLANEPRGVVPNPEWKQEIFNDNWRLGDTYITSIGQFGFQVTPLQMTRALGALATKGTFVTPHIVSENRAKTKNALANITEENFSLVLDGMRQTVTEGTAKSLNIKGVSVAAKTGTAQVGVNKENVHSWSTGFFPYENPHYSFAVIMEKGPVKDTVGASWAMRQLLDWMSENTPEYFEIDFE